MTDKRQILNDETSSRVVHTDVFGCSLTAQQIGHGDPAIFVHGLGSNRQTWAAVAARLKSRFTCFLLDLPGIGDSNATTTFDYSLENITKIVQGFIQKNELRNVTIIAHSFGAGIALLALVQADSDFIRRIAALCILD